MCFLLVCNFSEIKYYHIFDTRYSVSESCATMGQVHKFILILGRVGSGWGGSRKLDQSPTLCASQLSYSQIYLFYLFYNYCYHCRWWIKILNELRSSHLCRGTGEPRVDNSSTAPRLFRCFYVQRCCIARLAFTCPQLSTSSSSPSSSHHHHIIKNNTRHTARTCTPLELI